MRRRTLLLSVVALAGLAGVAVLGPRVPVEVEAPRVTVPTGSPSGLEDWVRRREAAFDDIVPGAEKRVVWANPEDPGPTPLVVVYLHGFSATRQEVSPLPERLADSLGANLFLTRLTGHGRGPEPMGEATLGSWLGDVAEALAVARELGDQVVLVGTSTGATLALWAAARLGLRERIAALLLISP
ncbi:MAG: alpha/beta fold hydrolase, partial [Gemmatimonadota bacterium]